MSLPLQSSAVSYNDASPVGFHPKCHAMLQCLKQSFQYCLHLNICLSDGDQTDAVLSLNIQDPQELRFERKQPKSVSLMWDMCMVSIHLSMRAPT